RAGSRSRVRAVDVVSGGRRVLLLRGRLLHPRRVDCQAAAGLSGLVERGDWQRLGGVGDGLLSLARTSANRRGPAAPSAGGNGRRRIGLGPGGWGLGLTVQAPSPRP